MGKAEHVEVLKECKAACRKWRKESDEKPDLSGEKLSHLDLSDFPSELLCSTHEAGVCIHAKR